MATIEPSTGQTLIHRHREYALSKDNPESMGLFRQALINGNFDVWQRGTTLGSTSAKVYIADRWQFFRGGGATGMTVSRQTAGLQGSLYSARAQRDSGNAGTGAMLFSQQLETVDTVKLQGQKLTLSFWAKCGANYSPTSSILVSNFYTGTGTDESFYSGFTGSATEKSQNNTLTTSWQKFTMTSTAAIGATITEVAVNFTATPTGTASTNDWFEIAQVQLCAGDVALPFMPKSEAEEKLACQRYCFVPDLSLALTSIAFGSARSTTVAGLFLPLPVTMRVTPTLTATAADYQLYDGNTAATDVTAIAKDDATNMGKDFFVIKATVASGLTQFRPYELFSDATTNRLMILDSEL